MTTMIIVKGDTNDSDYVNQIEKLRENQGDLKELVIKVANAIKSVTQEKKEYFKSKGLDFIPQFHNWNKNDYSFEEDTPHVIYKDFLTEEDVDNFNDYFCPRGIHTILSITMIDVNNEIELL